MNSYFNYSMSSQMEESFSITCEQGKRICLEHVPVGVPHYATSIIATGKLGIGPGELNCPHGVAIHEDTHEIFVVNADNGRVEIFSETGEFLYQLGVGHLSSDSTPWGIAIHGDSVYVSCLDHTISKFSLTEMCPVKRIGGYGSNNGQFNNPSQLTIDTIGRVFLADPENNRICVYNPDLNHLRNIMHLSMLKPFDVKVSRDCLYVLCQDGYSFVRILTLEGYKLHSFITCIAVMNMLNAYSFCFDHLNNIVINDISSQSINVLSPEGILLQTKRGVGHDQGLFYHPRGIAVTPNGRLVCVSDNENFGLEIFS